MYAKSLLAQLVGALLWWWTILPSFCFWFNIQMSSGPQMYFTPGCSKMEILGRYRCQYLNWQFGRNRYWFCVKEIKNSSVQRKKNEATDKWCDAQSAQAPHGHVNKFAMSLLSEGFSQLHSAVDQQMLTKHSRSLLTTGISGMPPYLSITYTSWYWYWA